MTRAVLIFSICLFAGCSHPAQKAAKKVGRKTRTVAVERTRVVSPITESPGVNLPLEARARNRDNGSCVFVSVESCTHWQNRSDKALEIRKTCKGGSGQERLHANLRRLGVPYVFTSSGDVSFIEWATRTRRGAMIFYFPNHAVTLVDLNEREAVLLDNNRVSRYIRIPRQTFLENWRRWGGAATTPMLGPPASPL
ncbi:MAG: hypothetical protein KGL39_34785 [Patescibacteria group bacterium]|nr:hypothetical protein [Patescibacteria group bacterium]